MASVVAPSLALTPPNKPEDMERAKREHWSYQPIADPTPPQVKHADHVADPIDAFVLARLEKANIEPAPTADRRTLIRRLSFDLTGLPPTYDQVQAFVNDKSPDAYAKLVDRLLASPQYGEHWARHWLDVARYADTIGYDGGGRMRKFPFAWTYRDYVIRSFNDDKPYNRFITEQIAADRMGLPEGDPALAGLGLLTVGRQFLGKINSITDDRIDVITRGIMAQTVACARCHDHKYDVIPTTDYYALYGVLRSVDVPEPMDMPVIGKPMGNDKQQASYQAELAKRTKAVEDHLQKVRDAVSKEITERADDYLKLAAGKVDMIDHIWRRLASHFKRAWQRAGKPDPTTPERKADIIKYVSELSQESPELFFNQGERNENNRLKGRVAALQLESPGAPPRAMVVTASKPFDPYVFIRGNQGARGDHVDRRFLTVLGGQKFTEGAGRLELARAVASDKNPLTARVWANRVWMHLLGEALVRTPGDFGNRGEQPTHPLLLDHLATQLIKSGWSTKQLIRRIVMSSTYRQANVINDDYAQRDPENRLIWRANRKRLMFEATRDALLSVAGRLDASLYGRPVDLFKSPYSTRRAVYGFIDRQDLPQTLRAFDFANPDQSTPERAVTTVPQQALFMMNSPFVIEQAQAVTKHTEAIADPGQRLVALYHRVYQRDPSASEMDLGRHYLGDKPSDDAWARYAQALLLSNEFVFVD
ncbi:DUF1553 domain-containing protein [Planctomycetales bacterium ZRK34]|nr:DUF1553 domain-containing protein [Planctomycetales bacterium ZRK34]